MSIKTATISPTGNSSKRRGRRGFTLVEVLISIVILVTGIMAVYRAFLTCLNVLQHLSNRSYALILMEDKVHQAQIRFLTGEQDPFQEIPKQEFVRVNGRPMRFQYESSSFFFPETNKIQQLKIGIFWREGPGLKSISRQALVAQFDPPPFPDQPR